MTLETTKYPQEPHSNSSETYRVPNATVFSKRLSHTLEVRARRVLDYIILFTNYDAAEIAVKEQGLYEQEFRLREISLYYKLNHDSFTRDCTKIVEDLTTLSVFEKPVDSDGLRGITLFALMDTTGAPYLRIALTRYGLEQLCSLKADGFQTVNSESLQPLRGKREILLHELLVTMDRGSHNVTVTSETLMNGLQLSPDKSYNKPGRLITDVVARTVKSLHRKLPHLYENLTYTKKRHIDAKHFNKATGRYDWSITFSFPQTSLNPSIKANEKSYKKSKDQRISSSRLNQKVSDIINALEALADAGHNVEIDYTNTHTLRQSLSALADQLLPDVGSSSSDIEQHRNTILNALKGSPEAQNSLLEQVINRLNQMDTGAKNEHS